MSGSRGLEARLAAWIHDPAEKAFVLMRDPAGHTGGTTAALYSKLFPGGLSDDVLATVEKADHWASAADRPDLPKEANGKYKPWARVDFQKEGVLIHPLDGGVTPLKQLVLGEVDWSEARALSTDHFNSLVVEDGASVDLERTMLNFWRFGPESPAKGLGALWRQLPAETRFPDHTIWAHLDLCSAFAGAMADDDDEKPALLLFSLGPVQSFIAQARTVLDLWAGSHLLSRLSWEAMKVVCEACGPQAVLFPQLRGVPLVDVWLEKEKNLSWPASVKQPEWKSSRTDSNPLFLASLPNRFVAVVPASRAAELARRAETAVREWLLGQAGKAADALWSEAGVAQTAPMCAADQVKRQCGGFLRVAWSTMSWGLADTLDGNGRLSLGADDRLRTGSMGKLAEQVYPVSGSGNPLESKAIKALEKGLGGAAVDMWKPNPGYLYPVVEGLCERLHAAAKNERSFEQSEQRGYRCTLCAEREWLAGDPATLEAHDRESSVPWSDLHNRRRGLARRGERLCAVCSLKRLWPRLFDEEAAGAVESGKLDRFNVSTHTMAVAGPLSQWLDEPTRKPPSQNLLDRLGEVEGRAALPRKIASRLRDAGEQVKIVARKLPILLDELREMEGDPAADGIADEARRFAPEQYYALLLGDGDDMGKWLAGEDEPYVLKSRERWHPKLIENAKNELAGSIDDLLKAPALPGPSRHVAISQALGSFSGTLAPWMVENECAGRLVYAGGDDVMAMLPVTDLLRAMILLRLGFSGTDPGQDAWQRLGMERCPLKRLGNGWAEHRGRLLRLMGSKSTMSCGAVVAHHQAPLAMVMRRLHAAEKKAKEVLGKDKDAFAITLIKRSGGALHLAAPWFSYQQATDGGRKIDLESSPAFVLAELAAEVGSGGFSRRVAYHSDQWLRDLHGGGAMDGSDWISMLSQTLAFQFDRQGGPAALAGRVVNAAVATRNRWKGKTDGGFPGLLKFVSAFMGVAEFLGREGRLGVEATAEPEQASAGGNG